MKKLKLNYKFLAFFLIVVIIFQSCAATYQGSYTLPEALAANRKVQITTISNNRIEYQKIDTLNGRWAGQKVMNDRLVYELINPKTITNIKLHRSNAAEAKEGQMVLGVIATVALVGIVLATAKIGL